jgi:hypothetical protein
MKPKDPNVCTCGAVKHPPFPCIPETMHGKFCIHLRNKQHIIARCTHANLQSGCNECPVSNPKEKA